MSVLSVATRLLGGLVKHWRASLVVLSLSAIASGVAWGLHRIETAERARIRAELALDSLEAVRDTTRLRLVETLEGEVRVFERRAVQAEDSIDAVSEALGQTVRARTRAEVRVRELETQVIGIIDREAPTFEGGDSIPGADFEIRRPPYTVWARALFADPPLLRFTVALDPIPLVLRIGCSDRFTGEVRQAQVGIQSPEWADVRIAAARQSPEVCNPRAPLLDSSSFWDSTPGHIAAGGVAAGSLYVVYRVGGFLGIW